MDKVALTAQQGAVVAHGEGPALVFAVAGAGKTTAMVHRIGRLVTEGVWPAERILATSFGRENVTDLREALRPWPACRRVDVRTLHSLGRDIIKEAVGLGVAEGWALDKSGEESDRQVLYATLARARREDVWYKHELDGMDQADFLDYVGGCKGNLLFAEGVPKGLPAEAVAIAGEAKAPSAKLDWYLDLYQLYERTRREMGVVTFDDMLVLGWELLMRHDEVLMAVAGRYDGVMVDEFQDVNQAQAAILDALVAEHRNYMVIGDDDQTIYEWRGARPTFLLSFAEKYGGKTYVIDDNFRCPAGPLVLANRVIVNNKSRRPKRLQLTKGLAGQTELVIAPDLGGMGAQVVATLERGKKEGLGWQDMAVLVRVYAQTPVIEQALIQAEVPYWVSQPFYERLEIQTLVAYGRLAWWEARLLAGQAVTGGMTEQAIAAWFQLANRPKRYLSKQWRNRIARMMRSGRALSPQLEQLAESADEKWLVESFEYLADDLSWLAGSLEGEAAGVLRELVARLAYLDFWRESSGNAQVGAGRAASVQAFIEYARGKGDFISFMGHLKGLGEAAVGQKKGDKGDVVTLSSIHRAKGREWELVVVPGCNQETIPFGGWEADNIEEERRLLYVALTRAKGQLYLYATADEPLSPFLSEAKAGETLQAVRRLAHLLREGASAWTAGEALMVATLVREMRLERYFAQWWGESEGERREVAYVLQRLAFGLEQAGLWGQVGVEPEDFVLWQTVASLPTEKERPLPGMDLLSLGEKEARKARLTRLREQRVEREEGVSRGAGPVLAAEGLPLRLARVQAAVTAGDVEGMVLALGDESPAVRWQARVGLMSVEAGVRAAAVARGKER
ncbi:MAG TPA: ATP-dependent helicase, partial [Anaerolineae bacterium]|nr:ATP-dependent helicase [Anaerolineae bacterium]